MGREKIFEVRRVYNDVNFIDEFMTPEFIEKHKFYQYGRDPHTGQLRILSRDPQRIKQTLLYQLTNMGQPFIYVVDGNYCNRGELFMAHKHNGLDIEIKFAVETLKNVYKIWQRPVHLQARIDDDMILFSFDGTSPNSRRSMMTCPSRPIRCPERYRPAFSPVDLASSSRHTRDSEPIESTTFPAQTPGYRGRDVLSKLARHDSNNM